MVCSWQDAFGWRIRIMAGELPKTKSIINEALRFSTDLGFFTEVENIERTEILGNFPQTFVHASFIGAVVDLKKAKINA